MKNNRKIGEGVKQLERKLKIEETKERERVVSGLITVCVQQKNISVKTISPGASEGL